MARQMKIVTKIVNFPMRRVALPVFYIGDHGVKRSEFVSHRFYSLFFT